LGGFGVYGAAVAALTIGLTIYAPFEQWRGLVALVAGGAAAWTLCVFFHLGQAAPLRWRQQLGQPLSSCPPRMNRLSGSEAKFHCSRR